MSDEAELSPAEARAKEAFEKAQRILLAELHEAMADRPAHREYLDALMESDAGELFDVPIPAGVSGRVAEAIHTDVLWIKDTWTPGYHFRSGPERAYTHRRFVDARAAAERRRDAESLGALLRLPGLNTKEKEPE